MINNIKDGSLQGLGRLSSSVLTVSIFGCTDPVMLNYNANATIDDDSCIATGAGCMDPLADNYNAAANVNSGCQYLGCTNSTFIEYNSNANVDDGSCLTPISYGCTDNSTHLISGFTYFNFFNYSSSASVACSGSNATGDIPCVVDEIGIMQTGPNCCCVSTVLGCTDSLADNYNVAANTDYDVNSPEACYYPVYGCTDPLADNYDPLANVNAVSSTIPVNPCFYYVYGCTDPNASNYQATANTDDGSCIASIYGCTDPNAFNYDPLANVNAFSATSSTNPCIGVVLGCTDPAAYNYNCVAGNTPTGGVVGCGDYVNTDDGSCEPIVLGCNSAGYWNSDCAFGNNASAPCSDGVNMFSGTCIDFAYGCTDNTAVNFDANANTDDSSCIATVVGCTDPTAANFDSSANDPGTIYLPNFIEQPSCLYNPGCTDSLYVEFDSLADFDDGSCLTLHISGCTDNAAFNYDATATLDNGTCIAVANGCTDSTQFNYDVNANTNDGSCVATATGCTDATYVEYDPNANTDDGSCLTQIISGCTDDGLTNDLTQIAATNYDPNATIDDGSCTYIMPFQHTNTLGSTGNISKPALDGGWTLNPSSLYSTIRPVWNIAKSPLLTPAWVQNGLGPTISFVNPTFPGQSNQTSQLTSFDWQFSITDPDATSPNGSYWRQPSGFGYVYDSSGNGNSNDGSFIYSTPATLLRYKKGQGSQVYYKGVNETGAAYSTDNVSGQNYSQTITFKFDNPNIPDFAETAVYQPLVGCPAASNCTGVDTGSVFVSPGNAQDGELAFPNTDSCNDFFNFTNQGC